jgi:hypothetical protein
LSNEQAALQDSDQPKLLTSDINDKGEALRREVNYLITKSKYFKPKTTTKAPKEEKDSKKESKSESDSQKAKDTKTKDETNTEKEAENKEKTREDTSNTDEGMFTGVHYRFYTFSSKDLFLSLKGTKTESTANPEL